MPPNENLDPQKANGARNGKYVINRKDILSFITSLKFN